MGSEPPWFAAPQHNRTFAITMYICFCLFYTLGVMAPAIVPAAMLLVYLGHVPAVLLYVLILAMAMDFVIPVDDGFKPRLQRAQSFFRLFGEGGAAYFPARTICKAKLSREKGYILAAWPHGLLGGCGHFCFVDLHLQGFHTITSGASVLKYLPFLRRFMLMCGFVDVGKGSLSRVLGSKGPTYPFNVVHLVVGGIAEMFYGSQGVEQIVLSKRKGFVKLAMQTGAGIIPCYSYGTNEMYYRPCGPRSVLARLSSSLQVSLVPWCGRWYVPFSFVPFKVPVLTVIGAVFETPHKPEPTDAEVEATHAAFCEVMISLFDTHKVDYVAMGGDSKWLEKTLKLEDEP